MLAAFSLHNHRRVVPALTSSAATTPTVRSAATPTSGSAKKPAPKSPESSAAPSTKTPTTTSNNTRLRDLPTPRERAVPLLIEFVKTHKSRAVREKAMFWLVQTDDPRALELIEGILLK